MWAVSSTIGGVGVLHSYPPCAVQIYKVRGIFPVVVFQILINEVSPDLSPDVKGGVASQTSGRHS